MGKHIKICPYDFGNNECYRYMLDTWEQDRQDKWNLDYLFEQFLREEVQVLLDSQILYQQADGVAQLSFNVYGTVPYWVCEYTRDKFCHIDELLLKFPRQTRCQAQTLKNLLSFLENFDQVETFDLSAGGQTFVITRNRTDRQEEEMNSMFWASKDLEGKYVYQAPIDATVPEFMSFQVDPGISS